MCDDKRKAFLLEYLKPHLPVDIYVDLEAELDLTPEDLDPESPKFKAIVNQAMQRLEETVKE